MDTRQRDELVLVTEFAQFVLEPGDGPVIEVLLPVETRGTVIGQQFVRVLRQYGLGELAREAIGVRVITLSDCNELVSAIHIATYIRTCEFK